MTVLVFSVMKIILQHMEKMVFFRLCKFFSLEVRCFGFLMFSSSENTFFEPNGSRLWVFRKSSSDIVSIPIEMYNRPMWDSDYTAV